jgi:uncharacterized protein involved in exopolysaccharide biosynthesis
MEAREEIYFRDFVHLVWRAKWWMAVCTALAVGIGASMYANAIPQYEITMALVPVDDRQNPWEQGGQGVSSIASQFLGMPVGDRRMQNAQQFLALFKSPTVLERVDKQMALLPHLFFRSWDSEREQWIAPTGWTTQLRTMLRSDLPWVAPSLADASKYLEREMEVETTNGGGLVEVRFVDRDPAFGTALLESLYRESDEVMRSRARAQNDEHISYIQKSLSTVSYAETRQSLTSLLTVEVGQKIMINSNSPYAMEVLKPAFADPRPVSPSLTRFTLIAIGAGLACGIGASILAGALRPRRRLDKRPKQAALGVNKIPVPQEI